MVHANRSNVEINRYKLKIYEEFIFFHFNSSYKLWLHPGIESPPKNHVEWKLGNNKNQNIF